MSRQKLKPDGGSFISMSIPNMEFHMGTDPVALFITSTGRIIPHKIKTKGRYFVKNTSHVRGIYSINNKYRYIWGKTPVYFFAVQETNQIDPIMVHELNMFMRKNALTELRRKDVRHASHLRLLLKQKKTIDEAIPIIKAEEDGNDAELNANVDEIVDSIDNQVKDLKEKHQKEIEISDSQKAYVLLEHLKKIGKIDEQDYARLMNAAETNVLLFDDLVDELKQKHIVTVSEPLNENVEDFVQDLGAQSAPELAGFVQDMVISKKGLKDLTPVPLKSIWGPGMLLAVIIGVMVGIPIIVSQLPAITSHLGGGGAPQPGAIKMPWDAIMGKFIIPYIPNFMMSWL